jgi:hypothetical protein
MGCIAVLGMGAFALFSFAIAAVDKAKQPAPADAAKEARPRDKDLSHFMRLKLEASGKVLEGLAVEDFALIKEGAQKLNEMSTAEKWRVSNDALYRNFSGDFQRVTGELVKAADDKNLDRAALKWMDVTMNCIECHRYARGIMIASITLPAEVTR